MSLRMALAAAAALLTAATSSPAQQAQEVLLDEWHAVFKSGRKCGYAHLGFVRVANEPGGGANVRGEIAIEISFGEGPDQLYRSVVTSIESGETGRLAWMRAVRGFGEKMKSAECVVGKDSYTVTGDGLETSTGAWQGGLAGPYFLHRERARLAAALEPFGMFEFDPFTGPVEWKRVAAGVEEVPMPGTTARLFKFEARAGSAQPVYEWRDAEGRLMRTYDPREDLSTVMSDAGTATGLSSSYRVTVAVSGRPNPDPESAAYFFEGPLASVGLDAPGQKVEAQASGVKVTVSRPRPFPPAAERPVFGSADVAPYTGFDRWVDWMDQEVQKKIAAVTSALPDSLEASLAAARWVGSSVARAEGGPFLTAPEALSAGVASPFSRAVLLCAICRGASVPARVVAGLKEDSGGMELSFWVEAFVGAWVSLDPDSPDGLTGGRHVRLALLDARSQHPEAFFNALAWDLQKTRVRRE